MAVSKTRHKELTIISAATPQELADAITEIRHSLGHDSFQVIPSDNGQYLIFEQTYHLPDSVKEKVIELQQERGMRECYKEAYQQCEERYEEMRKRFVGLCYKIDQENRDFYRWLKERQLHNPIGSHITRYRLLDSGIALRELIGLDREEIRQRFKQPGENYIRKDALDGLEKGLQLFKRFLAEKQG